MSAVAVEQIQLIDLAKLEIHPSNPRKDVGDIGPLSDSIKKVGLIEPIVAIKKNGTFQVVAGSRRLAAAKRAKLEHIPVRVMELDEAEATAAALIENIQRKDLAPLEEAEAFRGWLMLTGKRNKDLAEAVGLDESTISNALRLLEAPEPLKAALNDSRITAAHARVALQLRDPSAIARLPLKKGITVDRLKERVDELNGEYESSGPGAELRAKAFLEKVRADHPKTTITWRTQGSSQPIDLVEVLGKPADAIAGEISDNDRYFNDRRPTSAAHDKICSCHAQEIVAGYNYSGPERTTFSLRRVCIDKKLYAKTQPKVKRARVARGDDAKPAKELTPKQLAALAVRQRKKAEAQATRSLALPTVDKKYAPIAKAMTIGLIPVNAARALAFAGVVNPDMGTDRQYIDEGSELAVWKRIAKMPAKKVSRLAQLFVAQIIAGELERLAAPAGWMKPEQQKANQEIAVAVAASFGLKISPKAPKKAKR